MKTFQKRFETGLDAFETNVAAVMLTSVLVGFLVAIFCRYLFKTSIPAMDECVTIAFTWIALFSSPNGTKHDGHVSFTVIYDALGEKAKAVLDVISKALILTILVILIKPSWETICFYKIRKTAIMKMPFNYLYLPYMYFLIMTVYYTVTGLIRDIKKLFGRKAEAGEETK